MGTKQASAEPRPLGSVRIAGGTASADSTWPPNAPDGRGSDWGPRRSTLQKVTCKLLIAFAATQVTFWLYGPGGRLVWASMSNCRTAPATLVHDTEVEPLACLWGQAFSLPPGFCPASRHKREERRLKAGGWSFYISDCMRL